MRRDAFDFTIHIFTGERPSHAAIRKPKSSSGIALPPLDSSENGPTARDDVFASSLRFDRRDVEDEPSRASMPKQRQGQGVRFQEHAEYAGIFDGNERSREVSVDPANVSRVSYSSSVAHSASQHRLNLRWPTMCSQLSRRHDCEYIARQWPQHFVVHVIPHSQTIPHMPLLMDCAGASVWHALASAVGKSIEIKHALHQVRLYDLCDAASV